MGFKIGEKTLETKRIAMVSFQVNNNIKLYESLFKTETFQDILYNAKDGAEIMELIREHTEVEVHPICWIYNEMGTYEEFKDKHNHLFEKNKKRYWFFENKNKKFDIEVVDFFDKEKTVEPKQITDLRRREILGLPIPSQTETEFKLVHCFVPYMERQIAERFFKYPLFRKVIMKMKLEQVKELVDTLGITHQNTQFLYFNSQEDLELETKDFGKYGANCNFWWTPTSYKKT